MTTTHARPTLTGEGELALGHVGLGGLLVRVGAVPEGELLSVLGEGGLLVGGGVGDRVGRDVLATEVVRDGRVVRSGVREGLPESKEEEARQRLQSA